MVKRSVPPPSSNAPSSGSLEVSRGGYDEETALAVAPRLADLGVPVLEQPLPANRLTGYRRLKQLGALPIIMDEGVVSHVELEEFIKLDLLDGVAMKPARCGGLTGARKQIELLEKRGLMWLGSGLTDPDLSLAASLQLYGAHDLKTPAALNGPQFLSRAAFFSSLSPCRTVNWPSPWRPDWASQWTNRSSRLCGRPTSRSSPSPYREAAGDVGAPRPKGVRFGQNPCSGQRAGGASCHRHEKVAPPSPARSSGRSLSLSL